MAKIDGNVLSDLVNRAAALAKEHDLAAAKRLLMQVPVSQLFLAVQGFQGLLRSSSVNL